MQQGKRNKQKATSPKAVPAVLNAQRRWKIEYDTIRGSYINGFYDIAKMPQAEKLCGLIEEKQTMLNVADPQTIRLKING